MSGRAKRRKAAKRTGERDAPNKAQEQEAIGNGKN